MLRVTDFAFLIDGKGGSSWRRPLRDKCAYSIVILSVSEISRGSENGR